MLINIALKLVKLVIWISRKNRVHCVGFYEKTSDGLLSGCAHLAVH